MCALSLRADSLFCMVLCYMLPTLRTYVMRMRVTIVVDGVKLKLKGLSWEFTRTQAYRPRTDYAEAWWKEKWLWTEHLKPWVGNLQLLAMCSNDKSFYIPCKHYSRFLCNIPNYIPHNYTTHIDYIINKTFESNARIPKWCLQHWIRENCWKKTPLYN